MRAVRGAFGFSLAHRYAEAILRIAVLMALSRFVGPEGFGAFAVAWGIAHLLSSACQESVIAWVVRSDEAAEPSLRGPLIVSAAAAAVCGLSLFTFARPLAAFTGVPQAEGPFRILSVMFLVLPLQACFVGLLRRRLAFHLIAIIGVSAVFLGGVVSVSTGALGWQENAIAAGAAAEVSALAIGAMIAAWSGWQLARLPGAPLGEVARFCAQVSAGNILSELGKLTATLATARFLGPTAAGLYDRARRVTWTFGDLVLNVVSPVVLPALAEAKRAGRGFAQAYLFKLHALSAAAWPFFAALAIAAEPVVRVLLGPDWLEAVPLVRAACLFGLPLPFHVTDTPFLIASGQERAYLRIQAVTQALTLVLVLAAAQVSVAMVFVAYALGKVAKAIMTTQVLAGSFGLSPRDVLGAVAKSVLVAGGVALGAWAVQLSLPASDAWADALVNVAATGLVCGVSLIAMVLLTGHPVREEAGAALRHGAERLGLTLSR
nr:oligosaccharide flippase family protein [Parvularcula dongshanensis]